MSLARTAVNPNLRVVAGDAFARARDERLREYRRKWIENPQRGVVERFPIHLDIESTSVCNLKCTFCATTYASYQPGLVSLELFRKIVDEGAQKGLSSLKLNFRGEPLLHPKTPELVAYAKSRGILDVFFNTNATRLDERTGRALIEAGLDRLIVSFEGHDAQTYERYRVGADFERVVQNVRRFVALRRECGSATPLVRLQTVAVDASPGYLERYRAFWGENADEITCIDLRDEQRDYTGLSGAGWRCAYPWLRLCITWDGQALTCPYVGWDRDPARRPWQGLGSVVEQSIESIWHGDQMQALRAAMEAGACDGVEPCRRCSYRGTELLKLDRQEGL